jgi:hypothetical protein
MCYYEEEISVSIILRCLIKCRETFVTRSVKGVIRNTVLWMTLELQKLKASNGWSDTIISTLLELLTMVLPKPNGLPSTTYQVKKIIYPLILDIEKIHACLNHCILYKKT